MTLAADIHTLTPGAIVELFELDLTTLGGDVLRFHAGTNGVKAAITWAGNAYTPLPLEASGFDLSANGSLPRPKFKVANVAGTVSAWLTTYDGLLGAKVTRRRTLAQYLDAVNFPGGVNASADPSQEFPKEVWLVDRKSAENREFVELELSSPLDLPGVMLPGRSIIANLCTWRVRTWNASTGSFDYSKAQCPYVGSAYYDASGNVVSSPAQEAFSHRLDTCCKLRFGATAELPFGGFPAAQLIA